jgi:cytidylate kinase
MFIFGALASCDRGRRHLRGARRPLCARQPIVAALNARSQWPRRRLPARRRGATGERVRRPRAAQHCFVRCSTPYAEAGLIIAIDGPAASGKGTIARRLAAHYGLPHLDTGLLYRATAAGLLQADKDLRDVEAAVAAARGLGLTEFDEAALRGARMGEAASVVAAIPEVRAALVKAQRDFAARASGAVLDGRDIGTVICPSADVKIFVTASTATRAQRRALELMKRGEKIDYAAVLADIVRRDARDADRPDAPMRAAADAETLDTTRLDIENAFARAMAIVEARRRK